MTSSTTPFRTETLARPEERVPAMTVDVPASWVPTPPSNAVISGFMDEGELSPAYRTNIVVTAAGLPEDADLEAWQATLRDQQRATLPDLQILDDRRLPVPDQDAGADAGAGAETWYHSSAMTDQNGATVLTRRWSRIVPGLGITLTLTTLPLLDAEHGVLFDAIAASWAVAGTDAEEATDDHA